MQIEMRERAMAMARLQLAGPGAGDQHGIALLKDEAARRQIARHREDEWPRRHRPAAAARGKAFPLHSASPAGKVS
jgi:hypothetical protein